jgi:hypothetical protein
LNTPHQAYLAEDIRRELGLHREELVALAYFLGCDYTEGVTGVGIVNALEIVQAFPMRLHVDAADKITLKPALTGESGTSTAVTSSSNSGSATVGAISDGRYPLEGLLKFKQWLEGYDFSETVLTKQKVKQKAQAVKKKIKRKRKRGENGSMSKNKSKPCDDGKSDSDSDHDISSASSSGSDLEDEDKEHSPDAVGTESITGTKKGRSKKEMEKSSSNAADQAPGPEPSGSEGEVLVDGNKHSSATTSGSGEKIPPDLATRLVSVIVTAIESYIMCYPVLSSSASSNSSPISSSLFSLQFPYTPTAASVSLW